MLESSPVPGLWRICCTTHSHCSDDDKRSNNSFSHPSNRSQLSKKKKKKQAHSRRRTRLIGSLFHLCALEKRKKMHINHLRIQKHLRSPRTFLGRHASRFGSISLIHWQIKPLWRARKCLLIDQSLKCLGKYCDRFLLLTTASVAINSIPFLCTTTETAFLQRNPWQKTSTSTRNISPGMKTSTLWKFRATILYMYLFNYYYFIFFTN